MVVWITPGVRGLQIQTSDLTRLVEAMRRDVDILSDLKIVDYSLFLIVYDAENGDAFAPFFNHSWIFP